MEFQYETTPVLKHIIIIFLAAFQMCSIDRPKSEGYFDTRKARATSNFRRLEYYMGTQREYPLKHSIVKRILVFKR